jgi:hypothetical protein
VCKYAADQYPGACKHERICLAGQASPVLDDDEWEPDDDRHVKPTGPCPSLVAVVAARASGGRHHPWNEIDRLIAVWHRIASAPSLAAVRRIGRVVVTRLNTSPRARWWRLLQGRSATSNTLLLAFACEMRVGALVANVLPVARLIRTMIDGDREASSVVGTREAYFLPWRQ